MSLQLGETIEGKYRIVRLLGEGGMGAVYEGENTRIHRKVAIKVLHTQVAAKADVVQRFEREAQAAGHIGSEHIVEVLDLGNLPSGERFMVMEFLEGESLGERIKRKKRLKPHEMAQILHQLLEGLAAAHAANIIHRDLKPDNVFLMNAKGAQKDFVKVLDFGVSKFSALDNEMSMTKTGAVMGTPFYMAPEQARGAKIDNRSDLYSVGVVVYQAVTGRVPFHAETFNELVFKIALESPEPAELVAPGLDPAFAALIARAMTRDPGGRYQSAREFQAAVAQWMMTAAPEGSFDVGGIPASRQSVPGLAISSPGAPMVSAAPTSPGIGPGLGQSKPGFAQSAPGFAQSGSNPMLQSAPGFAQSGSNPMLQSSPQLGASQAGLAMSAPQAKKSGTLIAIGLAGFLVVAGGGIGVYRTFLAKPAGPPRSVAAATTTTAMGAPSATPTAAAEPSTTAAATAPPVTTVVAVNAPPPPVTPPRYNGPGPRGKASAAPSAAPKATAAPTAAAQPAGRAVGSEL